MSLYNTSDHMTNALNVHTKFTAHNTQATISSLKMYVSHSVYTHKVKQYPLSCFNRILIKLKDKILQQPNCHGFIRSMGKCYIYQGILTTDGIKMDLTDTGAKKGARIGTPWGENHTYQCEEYLCLHVCQGDGPIVV